ncbi:TRAP transporter TAXI family solute receptor [Methylobacterium sp. BE186]|uniref:TAXI family TRAP transporter solute-binding subunit n=1 Tax=Methylobacterium sp. BE186 TaxID=2817715 RepID=UPI002858A408|nr:TAXI family TRAP transporter solute-binding subunit [Methylobacterium sp. BE186]MDR7038908.1 TRAP transporter TAXI family solute receptor [Methylobacterium sp. BE186]
MTSRRTTLSALFGALALLAAPAALAREARPPEPSREARPEATNEAMIGEAMNANTVSVITGTPGGTYFRIGADLAFVLNDGDRIRVLPILGKGAGENAYDLRFLKGVDLGFVRTDTLDQLRQDKRLRDVEQRIHYIAKLFNDELHVIAPKGIDDVRQLAGKRVTFDVKGSGTDYSGRAMFRGLGLEVEAVNVDQPTALEMLRKGEVDAVVSVAAKPVSVVAGFDPGDRFHLVAIPYLETVSEAYVPATLTGADYPKLVDGGKPVETLAVGTILGVYNHPKGSERYRKLERFVGAFFGQFDKFLAPQRHPKWREVNLAASVTGWTRFKPAQDWLDAHREEPTPRAEIDRFLSEQPQDLAADKEQVYQAYLAWRRAQQASYGMARR